MAKAEIALPTAVAVGMACYGVFQLNMPSIAEVRVADQGDADISAAERSATWECIALTAVVSLLAADITPLVIGGGVTIALSWKYRHANTVNPITKRATGAGSSMAAMAQAQMPEAAPQVGGSPAPAVQSYGAMI